MRRKHPACNSRTENDFLFHSSSGLSGAGKAYTMAYKPCDGCRSGA
jgi:hypothetical protein